MTFLDKLVAQVLNISFPVLQIIEKFKNWILYIAKNSVLTIDQTVSDKLWCRELLLKSE